MLRRWLVWVMMLVRVSFIIFLIFPLVCFAEDLPRSISRDVHDGVVSGGFDLAYSHWLACGYSLDSLLLELGELRSRVLLLETDLEEVDECPGVFGALGCREVRSFVDGPGGGLWKPSSGLTGEPVFLLGSEFVLFPFVSVYGSRNEFLLRGSFRTCCPNGGRAHFDVPKSAGVLAQFAPLTIRLSSSTGQVVCYGVDDPTQRLD